MNNREEQIKNSLIEIDSKYFKRDERDFSYELYHKCRELIDGNDANSNVIEVTGETPKMIKPNSEIKSYCFFKKYFYSDNNKNSETEEPKYNRTPDLIFHEYANTKNQLIAMEIKNLNKSVRSIKVDISKLLVYTHSNLEYKKGIMLLFSEDKEGINKIEDDQEIKEVLKNHPQIEIWFATPENDNILKF